MADSKFQNTSSNATRTFDKELQEDINDFHLPPNSWTQARNAINNSKTGDIGKLGNEPSNLLCTSAAYTIIGVVHLEADRWAIFSTDGTNSEIGIFIEDLCQYTTVVNATCLNFSKEHLIKGQSRSTSDCNFEVYWDDGDNPSRYIPLLSDDPTQNAYTNPNSPIPWIKSCSVVNGCNICVNTPNLDCDKIRVAKFITPPCIKVQNGAGSGTLPNGSYMVFIAYSIRGQKISDWYMSNVQALFDHNNTSSSLDVSFDSIDTDFSEMIVVLCSVVNGQTVARRAGVYSTHQTRLSFDVIQNDWPAEPIETLPIMTPVANKSDAMYNVGPYLIRVGPTSKQDFNYQPRANQIRALWQSVEYASDYYRKGGNNVGHMRDEVYPYFIRWVYDTGDKSASYHIPGRAPFASDLTTISNADAAPEIADGLTPFNWRVYNTATVTSLATSTLPDGGVKIAEGYMGYWESSEIYPDDKPQIWNANVGAPPYPGTNPTDYDLCGKPIRHHRFPENNLHTTVNHFNSGSGSVIRIMGVRFDNILPPVLNDGITPVPGVIGFEILRGARNGNRTIIAKGLINNMGTYNIEGGTTVRSGAYPNYPYNDLRPDPFLSTTKTSWNNSLISGGVENNYNAQSSFSRNMFTFHGPDTNFTNPYLSTKELKIYGEVNGNVIGKFDFSEKHPKEKLITNFTFLIAAMAGIGISSLSLNGQRRVSTPMPQYQGMSVDGHPTVNTTNTETISDTTVWAAPYGVGNATTTGSHNSTGSQTPVAGTMLQTSPRLADVPAISAASAAYGAAYTAYNGTVDSGAILASNFVGATNEPLYNTLYGAYDGTSATSKALQHPARNVEQDDGVLKNIPATARLIAGAPIFLHYFTEGSESALRLVRSLIRFRHFDLRYHSHSDYNTFVNPIMGNQRRVITDQQYVGPQLTDFSTNVRINNLYRARCVAIKTGANVGDPTVQDRTRYRVTDVPTLTTTDPTASEFGWPAFGNQAEQKASSHYVALKQRIRNQYGQLTNIVQLLIPCSLTSHNPLEPSATGTLFGGDTYIGRYTEKNTFFYFYDWLYAQPDGAQLDYLAHRMLPFPRYWANFDEFETSDFTTSIIPAIASAPLNPNAWNATLPNDFYNLNGLLSTPSFMANTAGLKFSVQNAWFYLFNSGVRNFFVESEINLDLRDYGNQDSEVHYDPYRYTDTKALFDTAIIKSGNFYKYDQSLSVSKLFLNYVSWGSTQLRDYNPYLAETCYVYRPKRVIYSLPSQFESRRDNWLIYLANNYYDFMDRVTCIKPINKNGAVIFFDAASPVQFMGSDQLEFTSGNKVTIGDGGLFSQPLQNLINADRPYEYGSCQDRLSVVNTPAGVFWMSQNQGKVYNLANGIDEISMQDLKWWFAQYLPYKLTETFPTFELTDNPVIGIGCQSIYDNENQLVYFTKRDFTLKTNVAPGTVTYVAGDNFLVNGITPIKLGDTNYFDNASWTVSYDPKTKGWLSRHDWHPNLLIPGKNTFMSILDNGIWVHNQRCDSYCNYYGVDYPFEVEYMVNTPNQVNSLRNVEYIMEAYRYDSNCHDRFHFLDFNFDEAVIYNTEQCSGMLRLNLTPKNDPAAEIGYPIINPTFIDILYSKEENKYRFNQFWDITDDRGEFNLAAQRMIWNTEPNGYIRALNPINLNYNKAQTERKKFRHYTNSVLLRRRISGNVKILVSLATNKNLYSPR